jgi:hypothetical protein
LEKANRRSGGQPVETMTLSNRRKFGVFCKGPYGRRSRTKRLELCRA